MANHESETYNQDIFSFSLEKRLNFSYMLSLFAISLAVAAPGPETEAQPKSAEALTEECKVKYPKTPASLSLGDYLGYEQYDNQIWPIAPENQTPLFTTLRERLADVYKSSPERNQKLTKHIQQFAAEMVEKANSGDKSYKFVSDAHDKTPEDFEGFGRLQKGEYIGESNRHWERQEIANNIYRYEDGSYYPDPPTDYLAVADKHFISEFNISPGGFVECAYVPGNDATQGAWVNYYMFEGPGPSSWYKDTEQVQAETMHLRTVESIKETDNRAIKSLQLPEGL